MNLDQLERILRCARCGSGSVTTHSAPSCSRCGWEGRSFDGIADFADARALTGKHDEEMRAQANAVREHYENEMRVACHWDRISADALPAMLDEPKGMVLDLGCGTGSAGAALRRKGATVIGVDLSTACLSVAQRRLDSVVRADAAKLPFLDESFDALVARGALHHLPDADAALAEAARVLKRGGRALLIDPREFAWLEPVKRLLRRNDDSFTDDHHAYPVSAYAELIARHLTVLRTETFHAIGIMVAVGLDMVPVPRWIPRRLLARELYRLDRSLDHTPLRRAGHLVAVLARRA
jgi:demethylmenaquinone methyltransferase/2-methoxy-6-polyprenyl-1,4-benzoquinol methylase